MTTPETTIPVTPTPETPIPAVTPPETTPTATPPEAPSSPDPLAWTPIGETTWRGMPLPMMRRVDLLVVGGGTAGAIAAIAGGREGLRTLVVEPQAFLGGTQTGALVTPMMPNQVAGVPLNGGIDAEVNAAMRADGHSGRFKDGNEGWFDPEWLKVVLDRFLVGAGAEALFFTSFVDVLTEEGASGKDGSGSRAVTGAVLHGKRGLFAVEAARTIDATGDADVAVAAGVPVMAGDEAGEHQPLGYRFVLGSLDFDVLLPYLESLGRTDVTSAAEAGSDVPLVTSALVAGRNWPLEGLFRQGVDAGLLDEEDLNYVQFFTMSGRPGELAFNNPRLRDHIDGTNPFHLSHAATAGRAKIAPYAAFIRRFEPGCARATVTQMATQVGVRETRRIVGDYVLTSDDFFAARKFDDAIARNCYPIDLHRRTENAAKLLRLPEGEYHEIPYRCLVPQGAENLLVAGRALSADFAAQGAVRIQSTCRAMGEAAARAMALSLRAGVAPRAVDGVALRDHLRTHGARL